MPHVTLRYERAKLYEEIWEEPVTTVAKRYGVSDVAVEEHPCGIRAAYPQSRGIGIAALVTRAQVGDNPGSEHWGRSFHFDWIENLYRHLHQTA